jgi:hypothetical protein
MNVKDGLPRVAVAVENGPVTGLFDTAILGDARREPDHSSRNRVIVGAEVVQCRDVTFGNDEHMHRRFRFDVLECQ